MRVHFKNFHNNKAEQIHDILEVNNINRGRDEREGRREEEEREMKRSILTTWSYLVRVTNSRDELRIARVPLVCGQLLDKNCHFEKNPRKGVLLVLVFVLSLLLLLLLSFTITVIVAAIFRLDTFVTHGCRRAVVKKKCQHAWQ